MDTYSEYGNAIKKFIADNNMMSELEVIKFYRFTLAHEKMKEMKGAVWRKVRK